MRLPKKGDGLIRQMVCSLGRSRWGGLLRRLGFDFGFLPSKSTADRNCVGAIAGNVVGAVGGTRCFGPPAGAGGVGMAGGTLSGRGVAALFRQVFARMCDVIPLVTSKG
jgi:hypothetical protein